MQTYRLKAAEGGWAYEQAEDFYLKKNSVAEIWSQMKHKVKSFVAFMAAIGESTDITDAAQLAIHSRHGGQAASSWCWWPTPHRMPLSTLWGACEMQLSEKTMNTYCGHLKIMNIVRHRFINWIFSECTFNVVDRLNVERLSQSQAVHHVSCKWSVESEVFVCFLFLWASCTCKH